MCVAGQSHQQLISLSINKQVFTKQYEVTTQRPNQPGEK